MTTLATLTVKILGDTGQLVSSLDRAQKRSKSFSDGLRKARGPLLAMTGAAVALGGGAVKAFGDFDQAMTQSLAIMDNVSDMMRNEMVAAAEEVGKTTTFSARDAAESFFFLASAGLDAEASVKALPAVAAFAQAGMFDMARATDLLTDAQSALGLTIRDDAVANMENMVRVSDTLAKANSLANASVEQFSEALTNKAGTALRQVGKDIEEGVAVLAAYADQGVKGSEAGTQLGIVMRDLQTKAIQNVSAFEKQNIAVFDSSGEMRNFADILSDLERNLEGASDATKKATLLNLGFSDKSVSALNTIIGMSDAIRDYESQLRSAGGATSVMVDKQLESFNSKMKIARDRTAIAAAHLGAKFAPVVLKVVGVLEKAVGWFSKLDDRTLAVIATTLGIVAALGALGLILPPLITAFGAISAIWGVLTAVQTLGAAAVWANVTAWLALNVATGGIILGIGLLVAGLVLLVKNWDTVVRAVKTGANFIIGVLEKLINFWLDVYVNPLIKALNAVGQFFGVHVDEIEVKMGRISTASKEMTENLNTDVGEFERVSNDAYSSIERNFGTFTSTASESFSVMTEEIVSDIKTLEDRFAEFGMTRIDREQTAIAKILFISEDLAAAQLELMAKGTLKFIQDNKVKLAAHDKYANSFMSKSEAMLSAELDRIEEVARARAKDTETALSEMETLGERFGEFAEKRLIREQDMITRIHFMAADLADSQAELAAKGTQRFIEENDLKLRAFELYSQGFMSIEEAMFRAELEHIEEIGRIRAADLTIRIKQEEEMAKLQKRLDEEAFRAIREAVGIMPDRFQTNINMNLPSFGGEFGAAQLKAMQSFIDPLTGALVAKTITGDYRFIQPTNQRFGSDAERIERGRQMEEANRLLTERMTVVVEIHTPAVLGDNVEEVVAAGVRGALDRGLLERSEGLG